MLRVFALESCCSAIPANVGKPTNSDDGDQHRYLQADCDYDGARAYFYEVIAQQKQPEQQALEVDQLRQLIEKQSSDAEKLRKLLERKLPTPKHK